MSKDSSLEGNYPNKGVHLSNDLISRNESFEERCYMKFKYTHHLVEALEVVGDDLRARPVAVGDAAVVVVVVEQQAVHARPGVYPAGAVARPRGRHRDPHRSVPDAVRRPQQRRRRSVRHRRRLRVGELDARLPLWWTNEKKIDINITTVDVCD